MMASATDTPTPFRLLDLPAELRMRIYEYALTAPDNAIRIYYSFQKCRVNPGLGLPLLRTCRQVYNEARDVLYQENTVLVQANCHLTDSPVIGSSQLPPPALASLRRVFVVLDVSDSYAPIYKRVDFRPFQSMVQLRSLRIAAVSEIHWAQQSWTDLLSYVIERVPAHCKLEFGSQTSVEKTFTTRFCTLPYINIVEASKETLMRATGYCQAEQGCKSGSETDWRDADDALPFEEVRTW